MSQALSQRSTAAAPARARTRTHSKRTILIVDDSHDGVEMMTTLLGLKGYEVLSAENGLDAIEVARASFPDMILIDLELPKLDGLNVTRNLRLHPRLRKTPIIIVSGHDPAKHRQAALDAGCSDYLLKPIDFDRLDTILHDNFPLVG